MHHFQQIWAYSPLGPKLSREPGDPKHTECIFSELFTDVLKGLVLDILQCFLGAKELPIRINHHSIDIQIPADHIALEISGRHNIKVLVTHSGLFFRTSHSNFNLTVGGIPIEIDRKSLPHVLQTHLFQCVSRSVGDDIKILGLATQQHIPNTPTHKAEISLLIECVCHLFELLEHVQRQLDFLIMGKLNHRSLLGGHSHALVTPNFAWVLHV